MINNAKINSKKYLLVANEIYPSLFDEFAEIDTVDGKNLDTIQTERLTSKIKRAINMLKQIDVFAIEEKIGEDKADTIRHNINFMYEQLLYMQKRLLADKFIDGLKSTVPRYIKSMNEDPSNYKKWASDEQQLAGKFIGMIVSPEYIDAYIPQIKRMALGTMSQKEFKKIYNATKHKMIPIIKKFESFKEYNGDE